MKREDAAVIPMIAMTANAYPEDIQQGISCGMTDYLTKPVDLNVLYDMLKKAYQGISEETINAIG